MGLLEVIECNYNQKQFLNVPVIYQLPLLGIDSELVDLLKGQRVLDIGCGSGLLVDELRLRGIEAQGIDSRAPSGTHFMRQNVTSGKGVPVPNSCYAFITSFQNVALNDGLGAIQNPAEIPFFSYECISLKRFRKYQEEKAREAKFIVAEIGRTLLPLGRASIYPPLLKIERYAGSLLCELGLKVTHEPIANEDLVRNYFMWEGGNFDEERIKTEKRTILTKSKY